MNTLTAAEARGVSIRMQILWMVGRQRHIHETTIARHFFYDPDMPDLGMVKAAIDDLIQSGTVIYWRNGPGRVLRLKRGTT